MVMPRQSCPVCGNRPHVFRDRQRDAEIATLKAELAAAKKRIRELAKQIAS